MKKFFISFTSKLTIQNYVQSIPDWLCFMVISIFFSKNVNMTAS